MSSQRIITATEIRRNFNSIIGRLRQHHEHAIVQRGGTPIAVLLPIVEYEQLLRYKQLMMFDQFTQDLGREVEKYGLMANVKTQAKLAKKAAKAEAQV